MCLSFKKSENASGDLALYMSVCTTKMDELLYLMNVGWMVLTQLFLVWRLLLCTLALMLLGPMAMLYIYDIGLYAWRLLTSRKPRVSESLDECETMLDPLTADTDTILVNVDEGFYSDSDTAGSCDEHDPAAVAAESEASLAQRQPRSTPSAGSFTRLTDLIAVTFSTGSDSGRMENYEHEVKLISGTA